MRSMKRRGFLVFGERMEIKEGSMKRRGRRGFIPEGGGRVEVKVKYLNLRCTRDEIRFRDGNNEDFSS